MWQLDGRRTDEAVVTVLMPLKGYDDAYLAEAVNSVTEQSCPQWRLIVIGEPAGLRDLRRVLVPWLTDARVQIVANEGARLAGAVNTGMRHATTVFVALLCGDDLWAPDAVAVLIRRIREAPTTDFFHSSRRIIDDEGRPISSVHRASAQVTVADFHRRAPVKHLLCWRRSFALGIGGLDERSRSVGPDDLDLPWMMAEHYARFEAIDECLYLYRDHRRIERLTTDLPLTVHSRELRRIFRKHGMSRREARGRLAEARASYLRQCLYRSRFRRRFGRSLPNRTTAWRDSYR